MARQAALMTWLSNALGGTDLSACRIEPASSDASFRRYLRVTLPKGEQRIVMDAPPSHEDCRPFVQVAGLLQDAGLTAPEVLAQDLAQGFLLLTDLGPHTYLQKIVGTATDGSLNTLALDAPDIDRLFRDAISALVRWQMASRPGELPLYDEALLQREMALFPEWYAGRHLNRPLNDRELADFHQASQLLVDSALNQPSVFVHRDFMPRNLMVMEGHANPGILDFQDAVYGPISYDLISLLRDAFISWDEERVIDWAIRYWEAARKAALPVPDDFSEFYRQAEWMGLQRHLKVIGIFCRLNYRDEKPGYLVDLPRHLKYARDVCQRYGALKPLANLLDTLDPQPVTIGYTF